MILEYIKKKNFLFKKKRENNIQKDITENELLNNFRTEIADELIVENKNNKKEQKEG